MKLSPSKIKPNPTNTITIMVILASLVLTACGGGGDSSSPFVSNSTPNSYGSFSAVSTSKNQNKLSLSWTYDSNIPEIAGFKVYDAANNEICNTDVPDTRFLSCDYPFVESGEQAVTITAYNIYGNESAHSAPITANKAPRAVLKIDGLGNTVALDASQSSDFDHGSIVEYTWDFGDGSTYSGESIIHDYQPGTYTISLTVKDDQEAATTTKILLYIA